MHTRDTIYGEYAYRLSGESMCLWMSDERLEQQTTTIMEWFQERTMGWMLAHAPMHCYGDAIFCRVTTGIEELNEQLEYTIDGFDFEMDVKLNRICISFYLD